MAHRQLSELSELNRRGEKKKINAQIKLTNNWASTLIASGCTRAHTLTSQHRNGDREGKKMSRAIKNHVKYQ